MRTYRWSILVLLAAYMAASGCGGDKKGTAEAVAFPDSVVDGEFIVWVNSQPVVGKDLRTYAMIYTAADADSFRNRRFNLELLEGYIDRVVLWQEASAMGITIDDSTAGWFVYQFTRNMGGQEELDKHLRRAGVTRFELEKIIRMDLVIRKFLENDILSGIQVTDSLAHAYYDANPDQFVAPDSVRARHIIKTVTDDKQRLSVRNELLDIRARVLAGESFAELAKEHSDGPSAPRGGDLGYFTRRDMVAPFSDAAFALKPGQVSDIVETKYGYHLIYVEDKKPSRKLAYEEIREQLMRQLRRHVAATALQNHLQRSRAVAIIERNYKTDGS